MTEINSTSSMGTEPHSNSAKILGSFLDLTYIPDIVNQTKCPATISEYYRMVKKRDSDDPHDKAEGHLRIALLFKNGSFEAPDESKFQELINDCSKMFESKSTWQDSMTDKYGDPLPPEITRAHLLGLLGESKESEALYGSQADDPSKRAPTYEELIASIEDPELRADVKAAHTQGQAEGENWDKMHASMDEMISLDKNSLNNTFSNAHGSPQEGPLNEAKIDMGIKHSENIASLDNTPKPNDLSLTNTA